MAPNTSHRVSPRPAQARVRPVVSAQAGAGAAAKAPAHHPVPGIPAQRAARDDEPVSAVSILRREGRRVPHATDRPLQPRRREFRLPEPGASWGESPAVRRAGAAAGALVAAASVFAAAVLTDPPNRGVVDPVVVPPGPQDEAGTPPALGLLGPLAPGVGVGIGGPVSLAAFGTPAGSAVPTSSFLDPVVTGGVPGGPLAPPGGGPPGGSGGNPGGAGTGGGGSSSSGPVARLVGAVTDTVDKGAEALGDALPGPAGTTAKSLGSTVQDTGDALGRTVDGTVGGLLGSGGGSGGGGSGGGQLGGGGGGGSGGGHERAQSKVGHNGNGGGNSGSGGGLVGSPGKTASGLLGGG